MKRIRLAVLKVPVFINCRDRLTPLLQLLEWLERAGLDEVYLLDNDSRYEPLLEWYEKSPHKVIRLQTNHGRLALWSAPRVFKLTRGRPFVYTDPDIVPDPQSPLDAVDKFFALLNRFPAISKAGFGLRIDDIPNTYRHRDAVVAWERAYWRLRLCRGVYYAPIDTTFALYRPDAEMRFDAVRTGPPYIARHLSWYVDFGNLSEEEAFYQERAAHNTEHSTGTSHWSTPFLTREFQDAIEVARARRYWSRSEIHRQLRWRIRERPRLRQPTN